MRKIPVAGIRTHVPTCQKVTRLPPKLPRRPALCASLFPHPLLLVEVSMLIEGRIQYFVPIVRTKGPQEDRDGYFSNPKFCFVSLSSFCFHWKPRPFVQSFFVFRYECGPKATRSYLTTNWLRHFSVLVSFIFFLWRCRFFRVFLYHYRFLFVWRVRRTFSPSGWCFSTFSLSFVCLCFSLLSLELGRCSSDLFLSSRPRTGLATTCITGYGWGPIG